MESRYTGNELDVSGEHSYTLELKRNMDSSDDDSVETRVVLPKRRGRKRKLTQTDGLDDETAEEEEKKRLLSNFQERQRMEKLNTALEELRKCLPKQFHLCNRRMSKIRTLRLAMNYITTLTDVIKQDNIRREEVYRRTMLAAHVTPTAPGYFGSPDPNLTTPQTPRAHHTYHPYYTLFDLSANNSNPGLYQTPDPTTPRHASLQPRHLDFYSRTPVGSHTLNKRESPDEEKYSASIAPTLCYTPLTNNDSKRLSSPFLGHRNFNEFDTSFVCNTSDIYREEGTGQMKLPLEVMVPDQYQTTQSSSGDQALCHETETPEHHLLLMQK